MEFLPKNFPCPHKPSQGDGRGECADAHHKKIITKKKETATGQNRISRRKAGNDPPYYIVVRWLLFAAFCPVVKNVKRRSRVPRFPSEKPTALCKATKNPPEIGLVLPPSGSRPRSLTAASVQSAFAPSMSGRGGALLLLPFPPPPPHPGQYVRQSSANVSVCTRHGHRGQRRRYYVQLCIHLPGVEDVGCDGGGGIQCVHIACANLNLCVSGQDI